MSLLPADDRPKGALRAGILIGMCPKRLAEHLQDRNLKSYEEIKREIVRKITLESVNTRTDGGGSNKKGPSGDHMDVENLELSRSEKGWERKNEG